MIEAGGVDIRVGDYEVGEPTVIYVHVDGQLLCTSSRENIEEDLSAAEAIQARLRYNFLEMRDAWNNHGIIPDRMARPE
jgi:hypothetical protein